MEDEVRAHLLAGVLVADEAAVPVAEPVLGLVVVTFPHPQVPEHVLEDGLPEVPLHLVLAFEGLGQVFGLIAN